MRLRDDVGLTQCLKELCFHLAVQSLTTWCSCPHLQTRHECNANITNTNVANCARNTVQS